MFSSINRRDFLKFFSIGFAGLFVSPNLINRLETTQTAQVADLPLGRVLADGTYLYRKISVESEIVDELSKDDICEITGYAVDRKGLVPNRIWYNLDGKGYTHSRFVQPVRMRVNLPAHTLPETGCLGEITVPFIDAYSSVDKHQKPLYRLYFASTFWVTDLVANSYGSIWYQLLDDRNNSKFYVPAYAVRLVPKEELTPLSSQIPFNEKTLLVTLSEQSVTAYEGETAVNYFRVSTGVRTEEGGFATPKGAYRTNTKRPCRHMFEPSSEFGTGYDLPGVPWVCYFTRDGVAFHGAYWQNNFGVPYSHGCINMNPQAAKWVYRWTTPDVPHDKNFFGDTNGTRVVIE